MYSIRSFQLPHEKNNHMSILYKKLFILHINNVIGNFWSVNPRIYNK